jgi:predicted CXXCH cytochrome family protein
MGTQDRIIFAGVEEPMILKRAFGVSILSLLFISPWTHSEESAAYVGSKKCAACHSSIDKTWQETRHAKAIESLKKSHQENLPNCVKCHVTGYERDGGFIDNELTPEMAGVQCEVCHGPGGAHVKSPMGNKMVKESGEELCRQCHTKGQDPGFNYKEKVKLVHGAKQ